MLSSIVVMLVACVLYFYSLNGDFVFDDSEAVVKNQDVSSESWDRAFYNDYWGTDIRSTASHKSYRPLTILSFRLNYFLNNNKLSPYQFKATNLVIHIMNTELVRKLYGIITKDFNYKTSKMWLDNVPIVSTLVFAVHPIHVEAVSGIVGRADLLACLTFLVSFMCYRNSMDYSKHFILKCIYLALSVILAGMSMLFKENGITVVGFCIAYDLVFFYQNKYVTHKKSKTNTTSPLLIRIGVMILTATLFLYGRWYIMGSSKPVFKAIDNPAAFAKDLLTRVNILFIIVLFCLISKKVRIVWNYIGLCTILMINNEVLTYNYIYFLNFLLFIWPYWSCYDWSMGCVPLLKSIRDFRTQYIVLLYLYGLMMLFTIYRKRNQGYGGLILVACLLIVIPFLPASNLLFPVGFVIAERILYIPSIGYCLLIGIGFQKIRAWKRKAMFIKISLFCVFLICYSIRTYERAMIWRKEYDLFKSALPVCPLNAKVHYNMAKVQEYVRTPDSAQIAEFEYREAISLYHGYYQAMNNLANLLKSKNQLVEAEELLEKAIRIKTDFPAAWMNLGIVLAATHRHEKALKAYQMAMVHRKNYPDCLYNMGNLYHDMNRLDEAIDSWLQAIKLNSSHALSWTNMLAYLEESGRVEQALEYIPKALAAVPESARVHYTAANIYGKLDRYEESEKLFHKTIELLGSQVEAQHYSNLGILYHRWRKYDKAETMYWTALTLDPDHDATLKNLKQLMQRKDESSDKYL